MVIEFGNVKSLSTDDVINCNDLETKSKFKSSFNKSEFSNSLGANMSEASIAFTVLLFDSDDWLAESSLFNNSICVVGCCEGDKWKKNFIKNFVSL